MLRMTIPEVTPGKVRIMDVIPLVGKTYPFLFKNSYSPRPGKVKNTRFLVRVMMDRKEKISV